MKLLLLFCLTASIFAASVDLDPEDNLNEEEFEEEFHVAPADDPEEELKREEALVVNENMIKETNEKFLNGEITWYDAVNEFDNLPEGEFDAEKTGAVIPNENVFGRGLLEPLPEERVDERSERYFDRFRYSRVAAPASYSSVDLGNVSPVKDQKQCGSCVAFSNMALVETCFKKVTGVFGDYSEQEFVDCGYGQNGANGCDGAAPHAYVKWSKDSGMGLFHESTYPYKNTEPTYTCPTDLPVFNQGAGVTDYYYTYNGDEETMKALVAQHGAVVTSVNADGPFQNYAGGIFAGCTSSDTNHAVTVVGYGSEGGVDFWLIKNSWSDRWGENGYIRLQRGVGMCGVGKTMVTVDCGAVNGPTDAPLTTAAPCEDKWSNCPELAQKSCYKTWVADDCKKSCGLCPGLTPAASNTCYDTYGNCADLAKTNCNKYADACKKSCGLCEGMTPHPSNTCFDGYSNCKDICNWYSGDQCNLACGRC